MWKHLILLQITISMLSCKRELPLNSGTQVATVSVESTDEEQTSLPPGKSVSLSTFSEIDTSGILLFPLAMNQEYKGSGLVSKRSYTEGWWNIVFHNNRTGSHHLLTEDKILIRHYSSAADNTDAIRLPDTLPYLFYHIISEDYNRDKQLSGEDPQYLFISDKGGYDLRRISPRNCNLLSWVFIKGTGKVLITARKDSDNNRKFDEKDEVVVFETNMEPGVEAAAIFPTSFRDKLNLLYQKQWAEPQPE